MLKPAFIEDNLRQLKIIARMAGSAVVVVGFADRIGKDIYNAAAILRRGKIRAVYHKTLLPNYGVFDEKRYFTPGAKPLVFNLRGSDPRKLGDTVLGISICEDVWFKEGPVKDEAKLGAKLILNINASPYHAGKIIEREKVVAQRAKENRVTIVYVNLVGGQDELVFDGQSMVVSPGGDVVARAKAFEEDLLVVDISSRNSKFKSPAFAKATAGRQNLELLPLVEEVYGALLLGTRDYISKNGFKKVAIGLSGGIDSSLVAVLAADALGSHNVIGISMPSPFTSKISKDDAKLLAKNLGIRFLTIPIGSLFKTYLRVLKPEFKGLKSGVAEENLQARIRGNILMAFANKFGWMVLTTGNKSETSVGYATLYGDTAGGFAAIKDVPKTLVYKLAAYRNALGLVIPQRVLARAPSAELRPGQKDTDSLPSYGTLDPILKAYVEEDKSVKEIVALGFPAATTRKVVSMVDGNEYKRRQAPPGIKITPKAFGKDRRMPITNRYTQLKKKNGKSYKKT